MIYILTARAGSIGEFLRHLGLQTGILRLDKNHQDGFSTLEILIALTIIIFSISAVMITVFGSQSLALDSQMTQAALYKAKAMLEQVRASAASSWDSAVSVSDNDGPFNGDLEIGDVDDYVKSVIGKVSWQANGSLRDLQISTLLADWQDAKELTCDTAHNFDWTKGTILGSVSLGGNITGTGVDVRNQIAYVTGDSATKTDEDFFVIDVSHPNAPSVLRKFSTGPGLVAVQVFGNYAYVANSSASGSSGQLQIIDISKPDSAYLRTTYRVPGSSGTDTPISLYYYQQKVFLGFPKSSSLAELQIIDVSKVDSPQVLGTWEFNTAVNDIYVSNGEVYVGTPLNGAELMKLDVHDPAHPKLVASYDAAGASGSGNAIARLGKNIYLGRTLGNQELHIMNVDNISISIANADIGNSSINGLKIQDNLIFMATNDAAKEFQVWNAADFAHISSQTFLDLTGHGTSLDCEGQIFYVTTDDPAHGLNIIASN